MIGITILTAMKISCLIIDDEPLARKRLLALVETMEDLHLLGQCKTGKEAISSIEELQPDLIFLGHPNEGYEWV